MIGIDIEWFRTHIHAASITFPAYSTSIYKFTQIAMNRVNQVLTSLFFLRAIN